MAVTGTAAPYAPAATVLAVIERHRNAAITRYDTATLERIGVSESLAPRTLQSLRLLGLVGEDGEPTDAMERIRVAPSSEFRNVLADVLRVAYEPIFAIVDPTIADSEQIEDAFRHYSPHGQRARMVSLFTGLLAAAGLIAEAPRSKPGPRPARSMKNGRAAAEKVLKSNGTVSTNELSQAPRDALPKPIEHTSGDRYDVTLESGGSVSILVDVNLFRLSMKDRDFVIDLVDRLTGYADATRNKGGEAHSSE